MTSTDAVETSSAPYYRPSGDELDLFLSGARSRLPILLKGPTGTGKTRLVERVAYELGRPLLTVACHEDLSATDLVGRYLLDGERTQWLDGPLTRAVRDGAICYLDEVVEARQDVIVVLHPVSDHRRRLPVERLGVELDAHPDFQLVMSFNPGYQSALKDLKPSTRQRFLAITLHHPPEEAEIEIVRHEGGVSTDAAHRLVALGRALRDDNTLALLAPASTRLLVSAARLYAGGVPLARAASAAVLEALTDDEDDLVALGAILDACVGPEAPLR